MRLYPRKNRYVNCNLLLSRLILMLTFWYTFSFTVSATQYIAVYMTSTRMHVSVSGKSDRMSKFTCYIDSITDPEYTMLFLNYPSRCVELLEKFLTEKHSILHTIFNDNDQETIYLYLAMSMHHNTQWANQEQLDFVWKQGEQYAPIISNFLNRKIHLIAAETNDHLSKRIAQGYISQNAPSVLFTHYSTKAYGGLVSSVTKSPHEVSVSTNLFPSGTDKIGSKFAEPYKAIWTDWYEDALKKESTLADNTTSRACILDMIKRGASFYPQEFAPLIHVLAQDPFQYSCSLQEDYDHTLECCRYLLLGNNDAVYGEVIANIYSKGFDVASYHTLPKTCQLIELPHEQCTYDVTTAFPTLEACIKESVIELLIRTGLLLESYLKRVEHAGTSEIPIHLIMSENSDFLQEYLSTHLDSILHSKLPYIMMKINENVVDDNDVFSIKDEGYNFEDHFVRFIKNTVFMSLPKFHAALHITIKQLIEHRVTQLQSTSCNTPI